jgi:hypothetical protein
MKGDPITVFPDVRSSTVLFIKLGAGGHWERECIEKDQVIKLGFVEADHSDCLAGRWDRVHRYYVSRFRKRGNSNPKGNATSTVNQIKRFYEEPESTRWITFYNGKMWWCFASPKVTRLPQGDKIRRVRDRWSDQDASGKVLLAANLSGRLLQVQGFKGTICRVKVADYVQAKIKGDEPAEVSRARKALGALESALASLIQHLHWKDFETLVDLVLRHAGWQRIGQLGRTQKTLDIDLRAPVTGERAFAQIKSASGAREFTKYVSDFGQMKDYSKLFYIVHSPDKSLSMHATKSGAKMKNVRLILLPEITHLSVNAGLTDWITSKSS